MKAGQYIKITKIRAAENPSAPTPNWEDYIPGQNNGVVSLPVDYWAEGTLDQDVLAGLPVSLLRTIRNGVRVPGRMVTSPVTKITWSRFGRAASQVYWFAHTKNSVYMIEPKDEVPSV